MNAQVRQRSLVIALAVALLAAALRFGWSLLGFEGIPVAHQPPARLEGDVIDGRFVVERVGYESVDIRFVGFPDVPARRVGVSPHR